MKSLRVKADLAPGGPEALLSAMMGQDALILETGAGLD